MLETKTIVTIRFQARSGIHQAITERFENATVEAALRAILKNTTYVRVTGPGGKGVDIEVHIIPECSKDTSSHAPAVGELNTDGRSSDPSLHCARIRPTDLSEMPLSGDVFDADFPVRVQERKCAQTSYSQQRLALPFKGAQVSDTRMRAASEQLRLGGLRDAVRRETLSKVALTSPCVENRLQALEALAERHDQSNYARMILENALLDKNPQVQLRAADLLLEISKPEPASTR